MLAQYAAKSQGWGWSLYMGDQSLVIPLYLKYLCELFLQRRDGAQGTGLDHALTSGPCQSKSGVIRKG